LAFLLESPPSTSALFDTLRAKAITRPSSRICAVIGIPLIQFSLRYIFGNNIFRLGVFTELVGPPHSGKTALAHEIGRWHVYGTSALNLYDPTKTYSGAYVYIPAEPRFSPDLCESIVGLPTQDHPNLIVSGSIEVAEDWQNIITSWIRTHRDLAKKKENAPCANASCLVLDSLTAVTVAREAEGIWEDGHVTPNFGLLAGSLNTYFKVIPTELVNWPISLVATNHQKKQTDRRGFTVRYEPGGVSQRYHGTTILRVEQVEAKELIAENSRTMRLTLQKNSLSSAGSMREIDVSMRWIYDKNRESSANPRGQLSWFDWDTATVTTLLGMEGTRKKRVEDILPLEDISKERKTASCRQLGLKKASFQEIGAAINNDLQVQQALDQLFSITYRAMFQPGIPYTEQQDSAVRMGSTLIETPEPPGGEELKNE
jgi:RecA/RadA recombinase